MPKAFPRESREDVIRVYRDSDASMAQVAKDFGVSASCLKWWLVIDERKFSPRANSGGESTRAA
jgi:transposase